MTRKKIVAGNWKMNLQLQEAIELAKAIEITSAAVPDVEKILFPPLPYIQQLSVLVNGRNDLHIGAQNCSQFNKGAYTGEVAAAMIKSCGATYILVGHSERRQYFAETAAQLIGKITQAISQNLSVVFCFGEQLSERENNQHFDTVKNQLTEVLTQFPADKLSNLVLAYEPVWAIGTGLTASAEQAQEMHAFVRTVLSELFGAAAANSLSILYGGSCNAQNAKELFAGKDVDGGLIGGASLKSDDFCTIMKAFS